MRKTIVFLMILVLAAISSPSTCFCANSSESSNQVSIKQDHNCCSSSHSHCTMHLTNSCGEIHQTKIVSSSTEVSLEPKINFGSFSKRAEVDSEPSKFFHSTPFSKPETGLFLKNEVLRI